MNFLVVLYFYVFLRIISRAYKFLPTILIFKPSDEFPIHSFSNNKLIQLFTDNRYILVLYAIAKRLPLIASFLAVHDCICVALNILFSLKLTRFRALSMSNCHCCLISVVNLSFPDANYFETRIDLVKIEYRSKTYNFALKLKKKEAIEMSVVIKPDVG